MILGACILYNKIEPDHHEMEKIAHKSDHFQS